MEGLELQEKQKTTLAREILRMLDKADEYSAAGRHAGSDWERGLQDGKAMATQADAVRLGELVGLVTQGMSESVEKEIPDFRARVEELVA